MQSDNITNSNASNLRQHQTQIIVLAKWRLGYENKLVREKNKIPIKNLTRSSLGGYKILNYRIKSSGKQI